jgi:HSP20 family protein
MSNLTRWDPFREMLSLSKAMDRFVDNTLSTREGPWDDFSWTLPLDVIENEDGYLVMASVPGMKPDDLEVTYSNNTLTIKGEIKEDQSLKDKLFHLRERRTGSFVRSVALPNTIKADTITAEYKDGVVTLRLPKADEVKPRKITIKTNKMIGGK